MVEQGGSIYAALYISIYKDASPAVRFLSAADEVDRLVRIADPEPLGKNLCSENVAFGSK